jgi:hypothetical protein
MTTSFLERFPVPKDLTIEFVGTFARFEYALKRAAYVQGDESSVSADWDRLANELNALGAAALAPVFKCSSYLQKCPPTKQVLRAGELHWELRKGTCGSAIGDVLVDVRTVRNNVFHGGKFPDGPEPEPLRDEQLIKDCLAVLKSVLEIPSLPPAIAACFAADGEPAQMTEPGRSAPEEAKAHD